MSDLSRKGRRNSQVSVNATSSCRTVTQMFCSSAPIPSPASERRALLHFSVPVIVADTAWRPANNTAAAVQNPLMMSCIGFTQVELQRKKKCREKEQMVTRCPRYRKRLVVNNNTSDFTPSFNFRPDGHRAAVVRQGCAGRIRVAQPSASSCPVVQPVPVVQHLSAC